MGLLEKTVINLLYYVCILVKIVCIFATIQSVVSL